MSDPYAADKAVHFPERILALRAGQQPAPVQVLLSVCDLCDHDCPFCSFRDESLPTSSLFPMAGAKNPNRKMPLSKALEIIQDCAALGVRAIQLTGGGEPTLHPDFAEIAGAVTAAGMELGLVTNGCHLEKAMVSALAKAAWVRVSVDAGTPETYAKMHRTSESNWRKIWTGIVRLQGCGPEIGASFVLQRDNWTEVIRFARLAKTAGADNARITALTGPRGEDHFRPFAHEAEALCREAEKLAEDSFRVHNLFPSRAASLRPPKESACWYQHLAPFIGADLNVYRCCNTAYTPAGLVGSLAKQSFAALWESESKRRALADFDARGCPYCVFQDKNRALAALIAEPSGHTCFV